MRLWVVSELYYPEETSTGYYLTEIAEGLADRFDVKVLCGQPNYSKRGVRAQRRERRHSTEIFRKGGTRLNKDILAFRLINMLTLGASVLFSGILRFRRGDRILVVTTPPSLPFVVAIASLLRGSSYALLIHDSYPEVLIALNKLRGNGVLVSTINYLNRWLFKNARKIIVVGRDMAELVQKKASGLEVPVVAIPNWGETDEVFPKCREENLLIKQLGLGDKLIILHAGNIGHPTDVESVIGCLELLNGDRRFHFIFVGAGVKRKLLEDVCKQRRLHGLTLLNSRPRSEQIEFLNACDIGLVSLTAGMLGAAMPSKTYNLMAAGKPLLALADPASELARIIDEEEIGWHISPGDPQALKSVLDNIYSRRDSLPHMGQRARLAAVGKYSREKMIGLYAEELK